MDPRNARVDFDDIVSNLVKQETVHEIKYFEKDTSIHILIFMLSIFCLINGVFIFIILRKLPEIDGFVIFGSIFVGFSILFFGSWLYQGMKNGFKERQKVILKIDKRTSSANMKP